jgi:hypothetical protein
MSNAQTEAFNESKQEAELEKKSNQVVMDMELGLTKEEEAKIRGVRYEREKGYNY